MQKNLESEKIWGQRHLGVKRGFKEGKHKDSCGRTDLGE